MTTIHPSLTLVLDIDERLGTQETKLEIGRCYAHVGSPLVRTHAAQGEKPAANVARFIVSMGTKRYLMSSDEGADVLWAESVEPWLASMFFKVGNTMAAFNRRMRKIDLPELYFDRFDVELEGGRFVVSLSPDPENRIERTVAAQVGLARTLLNDGTLAGAVRVEAPSASAFAAQRTQALDAWNAAHPEPEQAAEGQSPEELEPEPRGPMKHYVGPMPDRATDPEAYEAWEAADRAAKSYENTAVAPTDSDDLPPIGNPIEQAEPERFDFDVDYRLWDVTFEDGSVRAFDSEARAFSN